MDLPYAHGGPPLRGRLRSAPEDFVVIEELGYDADGAGEHVLLTVEKRGVNTAWLAGELARFAGVPSRAVGYAGRKDRNALARQSFSVQLAGQAEPDWPAFAHAGVRIVASARHRRKLKTGALSGNRFEVTIRAIEGDLAQADDVLAAIARRGVPNYFGPQRFGRDGGNVPRALAMFAGRRMDRNARSMLISAARSHLFNAVLAERVAHGTWDGPLDGEVWCLDGSRARFGPEPLTDALRQRLAGGDIHPSGPLWGRGLLPTTAAARELELRVAAAWPDLVGGLERQRLDQERRPLRLGVRDFTWRWLGGEVLVLAFRLPAGCYATAVTRELVCFLPEGSIG